jgi:hypothetical protein
MRRAFIALIAICVASCTEQGWMEIAIEVSGIHVPGQLDELEVEVVASRTAATETGAATTCRSSDYSYLLSSPSDFPIVVLVVPSDSEWRCVALRAIGRHDDEEVIRAEQLYCTSLETTSEATLSLDSECHLNNDPPECAGDEICQVDQGRAECVPTTVGSLFEVTPSVSESCGGE